jgi:formate-dependent phosphoribosylglycinamide formyltransferase (GAR transformylase)
MYTKIDDQNHANKIKLFMDENPDALQKDIERKLRINWHRLKQLEKTGLVVLPKPLTRNEALNVGRQSLRRFYAR